MQKIALPFLFLFVAINVSSCSSKLNPEGTYQQTAIIPDGNLNEWGQPLRFGNKPGTIQYSVTNDKENVYVAMLCKDEPTEQKILRMGMTVYFDPSGGDNKNISLSYPMKNLGGPGLDDPKDKSGVNAAVNQRARKQEMMLQSSAFAITGFTHLDNRAYELTEKHPIELALKISDENYLAYEAAIPIKNILGHPLTVNDPMKNFSVGFIVKGFQSGDGAGGVPPVMTGGRGMGGGRRGGMGGRAVDSRSTAPNSPDRAALLKDDVNWYKFRLAYK